MFYPEKVTIDNNIVPNRQYWERQNDANRIKNAELIFYMIFLKLLNRSSSDCREVAVSSSCVHPVHKLDPTLTQLATQA